MAKFTRRQIAKLAGLTAIGAAAPRAFPNTLQAEDPVEKLQSQLAKPFDEQTKPLALEALKAIERLSVERKKTKLPENSEPCTVYVPTEPRR